MIGGHEAATHTRSVGEGDGVREFYEISVRVGNGDVLRKSAVVVETGHGYVGAEIRVAAPAVPAVAATQCEGDNHPITDVITADIATDLTNFANEFMAEDVG